MSRTWLCQYTKVKQHPRAGAGDPRETGWGAPSPRVFLFICFLLLYIFFSFLGVCVLWWLGGGQIGFAQGGPFIAPPCPVLPLVKCAGRSSGKRDDLNQGVWGCRGEWGWARPLLFCRKRGLVLRRSACHFNRGLSECRTRRLSR